MARPRFELAPHRVYTGNQFPHISCSVRKHRPIDLGDNLAVPLCGWDSGAGLRHARSFRTMSKLGERPAAAPESEPSPAPALDSLACRPAV
eukprot:scaffold676_cov115-Isochrysis_galbana.AAC.3